MATEFFARGDAHLIENELGCLSNAACIWAVHPEEAMRRIHAAEGVTSAWGAEWSTEEFESRLRRCEKQVHDPSVHERTRAVYEALGLVTTSGEQ